MTAPQLLAWITTALLLQLVAGVAWTLWRRSSAPAIVESPVTPTVRADAAWSGWREFRVIRREFEDPAQTQCSFHLAARRWGAAAAIQAGSVPDLLCGLVADSARAAAERARNHPLLLALRSPGSRRYRVTIKRVPAPPDRPELPPGVSSNHFHDRVRVGDVVKVKAPSGRFFIDPDPTVPAVLSRAASASRR